MKILLTGEAGFIGSNVADAYVSEDHDVLVVNNLSSDKEENLNPTAQMSVPASVEDPIFDADVNVFGFLNILEAARVSRVKKVISISSGGAIYGEAKEFPTSEKCTPVPLSPYAVSKAVSENYLAFYSHQYGLDYTVSATPTSTVRAIYPHGDAGMVPIFMDKLLLEPCALYHFGGHNAGLLLCGGRCERANLLALKDGSKEAFNII